MSIFCCDCKCNCTALAIIASIIIGVITAFLQLTGVITVTSAFLWVTLGIAVGYLAVTLIVSAITQGSNSQNCLCPILSVLLTGILGTVLLSVILLAITFAEGSVIGAIITGLLLVFFSLIFTASACLVKCLTRCNN